MPKILFLTLHRPNRSPSQRFRFEQYIPFLEEAGFEYDFSYLVNESDDKIFYAPGNILAKAFIIIKSTIKRFFELFNANQYDIIFVQRESYMLGTAFFEKVFARSKAKFIFDFDDAIWLLDVSEGNKKFAFLKNPRKTEEIVKVSDMVFAGNQYLANFAAQFNKNVKVIPTTIDTDYHLPARDTDFEKDKICIGWTGTMTTLKHFETILPVLEKLKEKFGDRIYFKLVVNKEIEYPSIALKSTLWDKEEEVSQLQDIDIGIMPLPDDKWAKGKCGFKGLQYMSLEIATIMSPVGVNSEIIRHGKNGYLANSNEEWINYLSKLIENHSLRRSLGIEGRKTIIDKYSVKAWKEEYVSILKKLAGE